MDLDALEALRSDAVAKRAEAAQLFDVSYERYREYRKTMERKARSAADAAYGASVDAFVVADKAARGAENALREAASDALPALITRLRAADARSAWQPIETAPMTLDYILTHGPRGHVVTRYCSALGWVDEDDRDVYFTHWQPLPAPPASEVSRD